MSLPTHFMQPRRRATPMSDTPQSPCVSICALDQNDVCEGCYRTGDGIVDWFTADDTRKQKILEASAQRRKEAGFSLF